MKKHSVWIGKKFIGVEINYPEKGMYERVRFLTETIGESSEIFELFSTWTDDVVQLVLGLSPGVDTTYTMR